MPLTTDGRQHLENAHDAAQRRWNPPTPTHGHGAISEYDPALPGVPPPGFRQTKAPITDPRVSVSRNPRGTGVGPPQWTPD
jgi:hypothetical protein